MRYLLLVAALLSPRPPTLMILNEPRPALHPDLLPALARLIARASRNAQIIVVLACRDRWSRRCRRPAPSEIVLEKQLGETVVPGEERPVWNWPTR